MTRIVLTDFQVKTLLFVAGHSVGSFTIRPQTFEVLARLGLIEQDQSEHWRPSASGARVVASLWRDDGVRAVS